MATIVKAFGTQAPHQDLEPLYIKRRELQAHDVELEILYCGICHSDLHTIANDWKGTTYPVVPGHEILGRVIQMGPSVSKFKKGDLVGIGCIVDSCGHCEHCQDGNEQFCEEGATISFNSPDKHLGGMTYGGFAKTYVCNENYVVHIPPFSSLPEVAPLLCAGITVYSPLKHWKVGPDTRVGILGLGGLGHLAIKIAKAMGAQVTVFTTSESKREDAMRLGADEVVNSTQRDELKRCTKQDFILDTIAAVHDINTYLKLLKVDGNLVLVGLPAEALQVGAFHLVKGRKSFSGSNIGGIAETQEMLDFCFRHNITATCEFISVAEINQAFQRLKRGDVKYRFVVDMKTL